MALAPALAGCDVSSLAAMAPIPGASQVQAATAKAQQTANAVNKVAKAVNTAVDIAKIYESVKDPMAKSAIGLGATDALACTTAQANLPANGPCSEAPASRTVQDCICAEIKNQHVCRAVAVFACNAPTPAVVAVAADTAGTAAPSTASTPSPTPAATPASAPEAIASAVVASSACAKDFDCKGDRICVAGQCTSPPPASPTTAVAASAPPPTLRVAATGAASASSCRDGKVMSDETQGHCCWDGQVWNGSRCVGVPSSCPGGLDADVNRQDCVRPACTGGQVRAFDAVHCCWPGQAWSSSRNACIGLPTSCPQYTNKTADSCDPLPEDQVLELKCRAKNGDACMLIAADLTGADRDRYFQLACQAGTKAGCDAQKHAQDSQVAAKH
jgi:hypothetical protein